MKKPIQLVLATLMLGAAFAGNLVAETVNIRFTNAGAYTAGGPYANASETDQWNEIISDSYSVIDHSSGLLTDITGAATGISFTETTAGTDEFYLGGLSGNGLALFDEYAHRGGGGTMTFTISGLTASGLYNLYIYSGRDQVNEISSFTVDGFTQGTSYSGEQDSFVEGENYVVFDVLADASGLLSFTSSFGVINGFTLQSVPEPSAFAALAGLCALGFTASRRRRV